MDKAPSHTAADNGSVLHAGENCWRLEQADKVSFLIDGKAYFAVFRQAVKQAKKSIFIAGWDIDSRIALLRDDPADGYPNRLGDLLNTAVKKQPGLQVYILLWDFAMLLGIEREWFPIYKLDWKTRRQVHLQMDDQHPIGASHHQKIVVIDDAIAFVGGLDLTKSRWDNPDHDRHDDRRITPEGKRYRPHHDVQMLVSGTPSRSLGELFRRRWRESSGRKIDSAPSLVSLWPEGVSPDITDCPVAIARTEPEYKERRGIYEVEKLYLDAIQKAEKYIYIENQYLTSPKISQALASRLTEKDGPEIIIVLPFMTDGWLSQSTMDIMRARVLEELRGADLYRRLGVFYPYEEGLAAAGSIKIHAKLMVVDDIFARIGSANLNNRSMGFDTECDLAVEVDPGQNEQVKAVINLRNRLLAEHLGTDPQTVHTTLERCKTILKTIDELQNGKRTLKKLEVSLDDAGRKIIESQDLLDPEKPIKPENLVERLLPLDKKEEGQFSFTGLFLVLFVFLGLACAWKFTPLQHVISTENIMAVVRKLQNDDLSFLYVMTAYVAGGVIVAPITALIILTVLIYGTYEGALFAVIGSCLSASLTYWLGYVLGRGRVRKLAGRRVNRLSRKLGNRGILATTAIRLMPVAPYSIVNIVAGASHIRFVDFIIGTALGLLPGILAIAGLVDRGIAVISKPGTTTILTMVGILIFVVVGIFGLRKWLQGDKM